jgi:hypothetical protein
VQVHDDRVSPVGLDCGAGQAAIHQKHRP